MKNTTKQRLVGKDFVNIGIYSVLIFVVAMAVSMLFVPFIAVMYPFIAAVCAFFTAPIFMLMTYKVAKRGTVMLCMIIFSLFYVVMGYVYMLPFGIVTGLLCEAVLWKRGAYRNFWYNVAGFSVFSILGYVVCSVLPIYIFGTEYYLEMQSGINPAAAVYIQYALSPLWMAVAVITTFVMAFIGCLIGQRMLRKHFMKAGLISKE
ncbi:MAG: MptD family putative ECF transporter S component [Candidatus Bathyarchaeota archaeon]|nr:MptD family putative ECF transporter S component [Candidatus Bathyarchaeota archaeon]